MQIYRITTSLVSYIFLMAFYQFFITQRFRKVESILICTVSTACMWGMEILKYTLFPGNALYYMTATVLQIVLTQGTAFYISETRDSKVIFTGLSGSNYVIAGGLSGSMAYIISGSQVWSVIVNILMNLIILILLTVRIRKVYLSFYDQKNMKSWWELCLVPMLFYASFFTFSIYPVSLSLNSNNLPGTAMLIVTMFVSYLVVFRYVQNEMKRSEVYWENVLFETYIKGLKSQYEAVERSEQELRILRHDMRHFVGTLKSLLGQKQYKEAEEILMSEEKKIEDTRIIKYCENVQVNSIVSVMMEKAKALKVAVVLDLRLPEVLPVNSLDLASVIANLFENAIYSMLSLAEEERGVTILGRCVDDRLILELENPCREVLKINPVTKLPMSTKGEGHGIGLQSVAAFAEKVGAHFDCYCEKGIFTARLLAKF